MASGLKSIRDRVRVSEAFDLRMGKTPSRKNPAYWQEGSHDWVSIADLGSFGKYVGRTKERINDLAIRESGINPAPENTVLMSFKLSLGKTSITKEPVYTNEAIMAFVDKGTHPVDPSFMYHQCRTKDWNAGTNTAVMGKTLNKKTLGQALVFLPSLEEQRAIASRLDVVDKQIEESTKILGYLDDLAKSRFAEMFGDPTVENNIWPYRCLGEVCTVITGNTPSRKDPDNYGDYIEWCKTDNITDEKYLTKASEMLSEKGASKGRIAPAGSLLMACIAGSIKSIGKVAVADRQVAFNQQINAIVPGDSLNVDYLLWAFKLSKDYLCSSVHMQLKGILNKTTLSSKRFAVPPLALQEEFAGFVQQVDKSKSIARKQIEKLQLLYDSLAQEYFGD